MASRTIPIYHSPQSSSWDPNFTSFRDSMAPTASMYSEDFDRLRRDSTLPSVQPLRIQKAVSPADHAHPQQQIHDYGQTIRTSRLPLFTQVRSILHQKPLPDSVRATTNNNRNNNVEWHDYSGKISHDGKAPQVKPSTYDNVPYNGVHEARRRSSVQAVGFNRTRSLSPVSTLQEDEIHALAPTVTGYGGMRPDSPISSASISPIDNELTHRIPLSTPKLSAAPVIPVQVVKRKPAPAARVVTPERPSQPPAAAVSSPQHSSPLQISEPFRVDSKFGTPNPRSRFSWTTYDPSIAPTRPSMDFNSSPYNRPHGDSGMHSRFSWSTWNTGNTPQLRSDSPPPSPPPPMPRKYANPPVQSILSRARPIQRADRDERTPPLPPLASPRRVRTAQAITLNPPASSQTPRLVSTPVRSATTPTPHPIIMPTPTLSGTKKLPLPPELQSPSTDMTHLDALHRQLLDLEHQRRNVEKLIAEDSKIEKASPMHLSFTDYKDAQRRLAEHRATLAEIQLEERQIGIAIARSRRKEGEEEGLWVRRKGS